MLNDFEELTLRQLARETVEKFSDWGNGHCEWCFWVYRKYDPVHNCILLDVIGLVESWEGESGLEVS